MDSNSEYESLKAQRRNARGQYQATQGRIEDCEYRLSRLRRTKATLTEQKSLFKTLKNEEKTAVEKKRDNWMGQTFRDFQTKGNDLLSENESFFTGSLDAALDAVNNEITRLENQIANEYGLLGRLASWINSLSNKIENFFN